jgi:hypothetical protein
MTVRFVSSGRARRARSAALTAAAAAAAVTAAECPAHADMPRDTPTAIEVDRDATPAGRVGFGFDGGEPVDAWGASIAAGWIERPIRLGSGAFGGGSPATEPVRRRETLSLGGALALGDSVVLDLGIRASHQIGDRLTAGGNPDRLARYVLHDLRIGGRIRVVGDPGRAAMLRVDVTLPSGDAAQFAGDARWTAAWSLIGRATLPRDVVIAANAGIRLHGAEVVVGDRLIGDELFAAAGVAVPVPPTGPLGALASPVKLTGELLGSLGDHVGKLSGPSPLEARLGVIVQPLPELAVAAHAGIGLDDEIGAPQVRVILELAWTPRVIHPPAISQPRSPPSDPDLEPGDEPDDGPDAPAAPPPPPSRPHAAPQAPPDAPAAPPPPSAPPGM